MSITTCQKVTLISCSVLCVSLFLPRMLLPRAKQDAVQPEVGPGFYPPMKRRAPLPQDSEPWGVDPLHSLTPHTETVTKFKGIGRSKYNLMAQVIPIYGFGILLYILYIIYKLTCKGKPAKSGETATINAKMDYTQLNEYELARLQQRLLQTEQMMEMIVSGKSRRAASGRSRRNKQLKREEKLLKHLRQISELMHEGRLEGASPEMEAEEVPYFAGWEGYPEETYPEYEDEPSNRTRCRLVPLVDTASQPTAEALAERMEQEEEEVGPRKLEVLHEEDEDEEEEEEECPDKDMTQDEEEDEEESVDEKEEEEEEKEDESRLLLSPPSPMLASEKKEFLGLEVSNELRSHSQCKKITFSDHCDIYRYPREETYAGRGQEEEQEVEVEEEEEEEEEESGGEAEEEASDAGQEEGTDEDDPVMEAESLQFSCDVGTNPEREAEEETVDDLTWAGESPVPTGGPVPEHQSEQWAVSGLRMRNRRDT